MLHAHRRSRSWRGLLLLFKRADSFLVKVESLPSSSVQAELDFSFALRKCVCLFLPALLISVTESKWSKTLDGLVWLYLSQCAAAFFNSSSICVLALFVALMVPVRYIARIAATIIGSDVLKLDDRELVTSKASGLGWEHTGQPARTR